LKTTVHFLWF